MVSGRQKTVSLPPSTQQIALAFGIALFVLILFLAGRSAFERARNTAPGLAHGLSHGADREINDGSSGNVGLAHRSGTPPNGGGAASDQALYRTPPVVLPPLSFGASSSGGEAVFVSPGEKEAAQIALVPLHELMENVRRFDGVVWNGVSSDGMGKSMGQPAASSPKGNPSLLLDGLESQTALVSHPSYFPEPLRDDVAQTTREIRIYLETVRVAGVGSVKISGQSDVQTAAHRHLENGSRLLARLDSLAGGAAPADPSRASDLP